MSNINNSKIGKVMINPHDYHSFCFRGEGNANIVIGARKKETGERLVWRFAKVPGTHRMSTAPIGDDNHVYVNSFIRPFFHEKYLAKMTRISFNTLDVHQLGKIAMLNLNATVENFVDLHTLSHQSALPLEDLNEENGEVDLLSAVEMLDATYVDGEKGSVITIEIKPKQALNQAHESFGVPFCQNCINSIEKVFVQKRFSQMNDFCSVDLFSGNFEKMKQTVQALFIIPHRLLRIFKDGNLVYSEKDQFDEIKMNEMFFPKKDGTCEDLILAICLALSGSYSKEQFSLQSDSILGQILKAQKVDEIGILKAHKIYKTLSPEEQKTLFKRNELLKTGLQKVLNPNENENGAMAQLRKYFLGATMKDCSIMLSFRLLPSRCLSIPTVQLPNGKCFGYSIKIVDLDPKTARNLESGHKRLVAGIKIIKKDGEQPEEDRKLRPCF